MYGNKDPVFFLKDQNKTIFFLLQNPVTNKQQEHNDNNNNSSNLGVRWSKI